MRHIVVGNPVEQRKLCSLEVHSEMAWFGSRVEVTFIDDATGEPFGVTEMLPADLPESFEIDTTLHLGNEDWDVVEARPTTRAEYSKSRMLTLRLRRIELMDPSNISFSLPSICDPIPGLNDQPLSGNEFVLMEDDWRQFEFVSTALANEVDEEIENIRLIHENAAATVVWANIHVRSKPERPLVCTLALADLAESLDLSGESVGVTYVGAQSQIANGYAFRTSELTVYGIAFEGNVETIGFGQYSDASPCAPSVDLLRSLARDLTLDLVYWCRCVRVGPDDPLFTSLLSETD